MGTSCSPEFMFRSKLGSRNEDGISKALVEPLAPWESLAPPEAWTTLQCWWVNLLQSSCPAVPDGAGSQPGQREAAPAALDPISPVPGHRALLGGAITQLPLTPGTAGPLGCGCQGSGIVPPPCSSLSRAPGDPQLFVIPWSCSQAFMSPLPGPPQTFWPLWLYSGYLCRSDPSLSRDPPQSP